MAPHHHHQRSSSASLSLTDAHRRGSNADLYLDFADDQGHRTSSTVAPFGDRSSLTSSEATAYDDSAGEGDEIDLDREDDGGYYVSGAEAEKRGVMKSLGKLTGGGGGGGTSPYERLLPPLPVELSPGALGWEEKRSHLGRGRLGGRRGGRCCMMTGLVLLVGVGGWLMGLASGDEELRQTVGGVKEALQGANQTTFLAAKSGSLRCDPYTQHGVLNVNLTDPTGNNWEPLNSDCKPVDFMTLLYRATVHNEESDELDFLNGRTIGIVGDSVDRDHNEHFCAMTGGYLEMIGSDHVLTPAYPRGDEYPPEGYKNYFTGERTWPNYDQSRPYVCHNIKYNFRVVSIFHYGFRNRTSMIENHPHFYPPARLEDRFDQVLVPLLKGLSKTYGTSEVPDLVSVTPGFWGLMRQAVEDDRNRAELIASGMSQTEADAKFDVWRTMSREKREWNQGRVTQILRHFAQAWPVKPGQKKEAIRKPKILWRALHHIKEHHNIPFDRLEALDQIGRGVVDQLVSEGKAAEAGAASWSNWINKLKERVGFRASKMRENEALQDGLAHRLKVDEWGRRMMGQERHFRDDVHPLPLPGSFLYGNMLMESLKAAVVEREAANGASEFLRWK